MDPEQHLYTITDAGNSINVDAVDSSLGDSATTLEHHTKNFISVAPYLGIWH